MSIRVLEDAVIDRIAAGEVVERPASVLKELLENALDAGARRLTVQLKRGGVALVRVIDDGVGMSRDDAMLCIERHATSKIRSSDDLVGVVTHGFRGEALPSIASVSRFELRTRRAEDAVGTRVMVDGGRLVGIKDVACPPGTDVSVRSLFHHVPARRKFLRTRQTELNHCVEAVHRAVMRRPGLDVTLRHDGRELLRAPATVDPAQRVRDLIGKDAAVLVPVSHEAGEVSVTGLAGPVGTHRASRTGGTYLYVNDRFVRDPVLTRAVREAYRGLLPKGRHPVVVLSVTVPGDAVDVNVHPAKTEVRFRRPGAITHAVVDALSAAVRRSTERVAARPEPRRREEGLPLLDRTPSEGPRPSGSRLSALPAGFVADRPVVAEPPRPPSPSGAVDTGGPSGPVAAPEPPVGQDGATGPGDGTASGPAGPGAGEAARPPAAGGVGPGASATGSRTAPATPAGAPVALPSVGDPGGTPPVPEADDPLAGFALRATLGTGEHGERFAVGRAGGRDWLLDLRAVQVRVLEARLTAGAEAGGAPSQPLLAPVPVTLERAAVRAVIAHAEALADLGLELRGFGPGTVAVMALPAMLSVPDVPALLAALAEATPDTLATTLAEASAWTAPTEAQVSSWLAALAAQGVRPGPPWARPVAAEDWLRWVGEGGQGGG